MGTRLPFSLERAARGSKARAATFQTAHGTVQTPVFMPVGTQATVKGQTLASLKASRTRVLLANTYHLLLRPGPAVFQRFGGIHRFMNWDGPVLTDSGGFQIFSLPHARHMNEEGAQFQSYIDGATHLLSPESSIATQRAIGSDIMMVLDQCIPSTASYDEAETAMALTHRWAVRSLHARGEAPAALFGIVQGACHAELRKRSAEFLCTLPFDGLAIGGLAVGETQSERYSMTELVTDYLPEALPRYLMGVGTPLDLLESVHRGVDMFDCIMPSQLAQRGVVFTSHGKLRLRRSVYKFSEEPLDTRCECLACQHYSRAYLHHLIKASEVLGWHLLGLHNLTFYHRLMREMRDRILRGDFAAYYETKRVELLRDDADNPSQPPKRVRTRRSPRLGDYEIHQSAQGVYSIQQRSSGEVMHSVNDPSEEANRLYIEQSCLATRLTRQEPAEPLVIWDVGLGAAFNAMAIIRCFESCHTAALGYPPRPIHIVSFEQDLDPLTLAVRNPDCFIHIRHAAPVSVLQRGHWQHSSQCLRWELRQGDFPQQLVAAARPAIIFYDPFSFKTDTALWTVDIFEQIFARCEDVGAELYTYSASTAVRAALLAAGFFVAEGVGTGPKSSTTVAFSRSDVARVHPLRPQLLGSEWLTRWRRSHAKFPPLLAADAYARIERAIENHPQFRVTD
ncbi:MAG: tRNA guanosine(34) transglycosylase Tgt [Deltaproteobacteria bacterium]|nr:tRNA guanosine(34) transglycosylase Tgt [Deltaproteobacteria bacterium]